MLKDQQACKVLLTFAEKVASEDLLLFWEEVNLFHRRWDDYGSGEKAESLRENDAEEVISQYLNTGAPHQVSMHLSHSWSQRPMKRSPARLAPRKIADLQTPDVLLVVGV